MSVKQNIKTVATKPVTMTLSGTATGLELTAKGLDVLESGVKKSPAIVTSLLSLPFAAAKGYIMESEKVSAEVAEERAYHYAKQDLSLTIDELGVASGKLLAELLKDEPTSDGTDNKEVVGPTTLQ